MTGEEDGKKVLERKDFFDTKGKECPSCRLMRILTAVNKAQNQSLAGPLDQATPSLVGTGQDLAPNYPQLGLDKVENHVLRHPVLIRNKRTRKMFA